MSKLKERIDFLYEVYLESRKIENIKGRKILSIIAGMIFGHGITTIILGNGIFFFLIVSIMLALIVGFTSDVLLNNYTYLLQKDYWEKIEENQLNRYFCKSRYYSNLEEFFKLYDQLNKNEKEIMRIKFNNDYKSEYYKTKFYTEVLTEHLCYELDDKRNFTFEEIKIKLKEVKEQFKEEIFYAVQDKIIEIYINNAKDNEFLEIKSDLATYIENEFEDLNKQLDYANKIQEKLKKIKEKQNKKNEVKQKLEEIKSENEKIQTVNQEKINVLNKSI